MKLWDKNNDFKCIKYQNLNMLGVLNNIISLPNGNIACTAGQNAIIIILNNDLTCVKTIFAHFKIANSLINLSKDRIASLISMIYLFRLPWIRLYVSGTLKIIIVLRQFTFGVRYVSCCYCLMDILQLLHLIEL
jgi:hypothetical protein